jgi:ABC-type Mn2+/Zn2+ transport system permease subunit
MLNAFDPQVARTLGFPTGRWSLLWFLCLGVAISVVTKAVGVHLAFAYLVLPGLTALLLARRLAGILGVALFSSAAATVLGLWASYVFSLPAAPTVVTAACALLLGAALWANLRRG